MTPTVAAQWREGHDGLPVRGAGAARETPGSLRLFQFTMAGTVTVNLGVSVSGPARCTMTLPAVTRTVSAGALGAVVLRLRPTLNLVTTGALDVTTSVTLTCDVFYRLDAGTVTRSDQCTAADQPLRVSSLGGASATVRGAIGVSASLDGLNVVAGTASAALHAGFQPGGGTVAETDASAAFDLAAPLGGLWSGAPRAAVADGTAFSGVLSASARKPSRAAAPAVITVTPAAAYPWSVVSLSVDGAVAGSAATDGRGSGGTSAAVSCPVAGRYQWQVSGTVNGAPAAAAGWASCASPRVSPAYPGPAGQLPYPPAGVRLMTGAPAASAPVRQPWRVPPARPPLT
jgi:hypothetical protein